MSGIVVNELRKHNHNGREWTVAGQSQTTYCSYYSWRLGRSNVTLMHFPETRPPGRCRRPRGFKNRFPYIHKCSAYEYFAASRTTIVSDGTVPLRTSNLLFVVVLPHHDAYFPLDYSGIKLWLGHETILTLFSDLILYYILEDWGVLYFNYLMTLVNETGNSGFKFNFSYY